MKLIDGGSLLCCSVSIILVMLVVLVVDFRCLMLVFIVFSSVG